MPLTRTNDRKTANLSSKDGKKSKIKNAFSLPAGNDFSCPGATSFCQSICYAGKLEKLYPSFRELVLRNWELLKDAFMSEMFVLIDEMIIDFRADCDKWNAPKKFRIHADGDFFNMDYVQAWATVIQLNPDIQFWAYTRSDFAAEYLHNAQFPNLGLYFSGDPVNKVTAKEMEAKGINVAFVATTFSEAKDEFAGPRCPEQNGALPLIDKKGGACVTCGKCVFGRGNVLFAVKPKQ
jgi:hypothetical protein